MTTRVVIAGAGGFGRGVYSWIEGSARHRDKYGLSDIVFIDDDERPHNVSRSAIVSSIRKFVPLPEDEVLCAVADPRARRQIVRDLASRGAKFHTFVDDRAVIGNGVQIGEGTIICPGSVVSAHAVIGEHVHVNFNCSVGHDTELQEFSTLSPSVNVMGEVLIGFATFLGGSAAVLPRLRIGAEAMIGAGSVVVQDVDASTVVAGNPARPIVTTGEAQ